MLYLSALLLVLYAFVNVFGAWTLMRRKPWLAWFFMLAAALLIVSGIALVSALPTVLYLLALGLLLASLASYLNARLVLGRVLVFNHLLRALVALGLFALVLAALR